MDRFVSFAGSDSFVYPKTKADFGDMLTFPCLRDVAFPVVPTSDELDDAEAIEHPIIAALKEVGKLDSIEVVDEFEDDSCVCINVVAVVLGKSYGFSVWWLSREGYVEFVRAGDEKSDSRQHVIDHIIAHG